MGTSALRKTLEALGTSYQVIGKLYKGLTIAGCKGINKDVLEGIYALGHQYYESGNFKTASKIFRYLCFQNHRESRYMAALGVCECKQKNWETAENILKNAIDLSPLDTPSYFNLVFALVAQQKDSEASDVLKKVLFLCGDREDKAKERAFANTLLSQIGGNE